MAIARRKLIRQQPLPGAVATGTTGAVRPWHIAAVCVGLAALVFGVFGQTLRCGFVNFDDGDYVYANPVVTGGLTLKNLVWAFSVHAANWHPLTWLSHMLDCQLYGLNPAGHHLTNLLLHTATAILLFLVLRQMTGAFWRSAFVAAVFAIHPLRVESVAWVAERKDVLSGLFFVLAIGAYARYARRPRSPARYGLVMLLFALGLMCKPMLVTLPLVLLLLDYWPLQRLESPNRLVMEKLPLLALAGVCCATTLWAQHGAIQSGGSFSVPHRLGIAFVAPPVYLGQMVWPAGLAAFYPYPLNGLPAWELVLAGMLWAGLSAVAWQQRRGQPWLLVGWLWFVVMLLPVLGIIQAGGQAHADRYTYLPQIGIYVAVTWSVALQAAKWRTQSPSPGPFRLIIASLMAAVLAVLAVVARRQTTYWTDSETLWTHALACTTDNDVANHNLGLALYDQRDFKGAMTCFQRALEINRGYSPAHVSLGDTFLQLGRVDEAIAYYQSALQLEDGDWQVHCNLGIALLQKGNLDEAISQLQQALRLKPDYAVHNNLGIALLRKGKVDEAIAEYRQALEINAGYAEAHNNLGNALLQKGRTDEAIAQFQQALQINPAFAKAQNNIGRALLQKGNADEAILHCLKALELSPNYADARVNLGNAYAQKGEWSAAIAQLRQALELAPAEPEIQNGLAWLLATCPQAPFRNGDQAVQLARQANERAGGDNPKYLRTLAAALAETGQFGDAAQNAQTAMELARAAGQHDLVARLNEEGKHYKERLALHQ